MSIEDPYFVVRDEVQSAEAACARKLQKWRRVMQSSDTKASDARDLTSELRSNVRSAEWDLEDLEESVKVVESNPARFGISSDELENRKGFIRDSRLNLADMKAELEAPDVNERLLSMESSPSVKINMNPRYGHDNPAYRDYNQTQSQLLREQDDTLELVSGNVQNLKQMSRAIGDELDDQAGLLDQLGGEIDSAQGRMSATLAKIQRVTRRIRLSSDRRQWWAIGCLSLLIFILLVILFS